MLHFGTGKETGEKSWAGDGSIHMHACMQSIQSQGLMVPIVHIVGEEKKKVLTHESLL